MKKTTQHKGMIAWFASNPVAANLLMMFILIVGIKSAIDIRKTIQPDVEFNIVNVSMVYPGAAPEEVEQGIILKIEEAVKNIQSINRVDSIARESLATVSLQIDSSYKISDALNEIDSVVNAISGFPEQAEKPIISQQEVHIEALNISISGDLNEAEMKALTLEVRDELLQLSEISKIETYGHRADEITIEFSQETLRKYHLSLQQIADKIRQSSADIPGGAIKTSHGEILVRTKSQAYNQQDFANIILISQADGTKITLGDIATINDGFVEQTGFAEKDREPSMGMRVFAVNNQDMIEVANIAKQYIEEKSKTLPPQVKLEHWADITYYLDGRLDMMVENLALGALLVFLLLACFLEFKLAFWVMAGLPLCFLGTFIFLPTDMINVSINMISLFGFLLVLGVVVDDAIIIGESASSACEQGGHSLDNVIKGTLKVATPATFGVLTTIVAFLPTLLTDNLFSSMPEAMGWVVILCLVFSLIESKLILPAHLAHSKPSKSKLLTTFNKFPNRNNRKLNEYVDNIFLPFLNTCLKHRYITLASFIAILILTLGLVAGGFVRFVAIPAQPGDYLKFDLEMLEGSSNEHTYAASRKIIDTLYEIEEEYQQKHPDQKIIKHVLNWGYDGRFSLGILELTANEERDITAYELADLWREKAGNMPGSKVLAITNMDGQIGPAIAYKLLHDDLDVLKAAASELTEKFKSYYGTYDIRNAASSNTDEIKISLKPGAEAAGFNASYLGMQVRNAIYGAEAERFQRGTEEVKVMVKYQKDQRNNFNDVQQMYVRNQNGEEVPLSSVANIESSESLNSTSRINGERAVKVSTEVNKKVAQPSDITKEINETFLPELMQKYPGLSYKLDGESEEVNVLISQLFTGFIVAILGIYALLAIPLKSYTQPIIIMSIIPFGAIGAVIGHIIYGIPLDMFSFFGIIALAGVVVNDSLIMVDFINRQTQEGVSLNRTILDCTKQRFRAIIITSLTTFIGLVPMLMETSVQAQQVIPMAVSLSFGILFATGITLILIPTLYSITNDWKNRVKTSANHA